MIIWWIYYICEKDNVVQNNSNIAVPDSGMNRDKHPQDLSPSEYSFALNATIEGDDGSQLKIQNEPSTLLCKRFDGYKVIGYKNDIAGDNTYFFLSNPDDNTSKITFMRSLDYIKTVEDQLAGSGKDIHRILGERLEESDGRFDEICDLMEVLIEDGVDDPCLNFSIHHPIFDIEIKDEKCGKVIYWTDGYNPQRYVMVDKALNPDDDGDFWYHYHGYKTCGDDKPIERCRLACEKLRVFPLLSQPSIEPEVVEFGGSLRAGVYQFCVALCDEFGIEKTGYASLSNPIMLFDRQDVIIRNGIWGKSTNLGIRLKVSNLDRQVSHYKVGVIQNTVGFNGEQSPVLEYFIEGIHPISETTIYYMTDQYSQRTAAEKLGKDLPVYKTSRGMTSVGNRLLQYGMTVENEWNLQPVVNLLGHFANWFTSVAREDLYQDGVACSLYGSVMRDEVYPFGIRFVTDTGYRTAVFPLIPRPAEGNEMDDVYDSDAPEVKSVKENNPECGDPRRRKRWQYYNTAKYLDPLDSGSVVGGKCENEIEIVQYGYKEADYRTVNNVSVNIDVGDANISPEEAVDYMVGNIDSICNGDNNSNLCQAVNVDKSEAGDGITDYEFPGSCSNVKRESTVTSIIKSSIKNPVLSYVYRKDNELSYSEVSDIVQNASDSSSKIPYMFETGRNDTVMQEIQDGLNSIAEKKFGENPGTGEGGEGGGSVNTDDPDVNQSFYAQNVIKDISDVRILYEEITCSRGCSFDSADENPTMDEAMLPTYMPRRIPAVFTTGLAYQRSSWHKSQTDTVLSQVINESEGRDSNKDDPKQWLTFDYYVDNNDIEGKLKLVTSGRDFDTGMETEWASMDFTQNDLSDPITVWSVRNNRTKFKYYRHVNAGARWVKLDFEIYRSSLYDKTIDYMVVEILGNYNYPTGDSSTIGTCRITFWADANGTLLRNPLANNERRGAVISYTNKELFTFKESDFKNADGTYHPIYISIEAPYVVFMWAMAVRKPNDVDLCSVGRGFASSTGQLPAPLAVGIRMPELKSFSLKCDELHLSRLVKFSGKCISCGDKPINCAPRPYAKGDFAYWESFNNYPANFELYDSSKVKMSTSGSDVRNKIISSLTKWYGSPKYDGGKVSFDAMFCQKPIRHYKFPDNTVAPFMSGVNGDGVSQYDNMAYIYPMGFMIDDKIISEFLDIAYESGLITRDMRDSIVSYEIYRGDRILDRSVVCTGLGYDMIGNVDMDGNYELHANYPYNDLSDDRFIYSDKERSKPITHPFQKNGNIWYSFIGPDILFNKPDIPTEVVMDGYQVGASSGVFREVEDHPRWTILGSKANKIATSLATAEALSNLAASVAEFAYQAASQQYVGLGLANFANPAGIALTVVRMVQGIAKATTQSVVDIGKYRYQWQTAFIDRGPRRNYAYYYTSIGNYNSFIGISPGKSQSRGISSSKYMNGGLIPVTDVSTGSDVVNGHPLIINSIDRERSLFLSLGKTDYRMEYDGSIKYYDNSRVMDSCDYSNDSIAGMTSYSISKRSSIASPYMRIKKYVPSQYGDIEDVRWVSTGSVNDMSDREERMVYGGDIFISKMSVKRKFPMFYITQFGQGDMIPFAYNDYSNIGFPRFFVNYDTTDNTYDQTDSKTGTLFSFPERQSRYNVSCLQEDIYVKGKFYLFFYGIAQFLVESEINSNFRLAGSDPHEWFYPQAGDYIRWTQENMVPISKNEEFKFSGIYRQRYSLGTRKLPATYDSEFWDCAYQRPNGVIWSTSDVSENGMTDPWLSYKPMDYHEFKTSFGKLISMKGIESDQILARFENQVGLYNAIDVLAERISPENSELGTGGLFASRGIEYNNTTLGYSGTQSRDMISCEFGHFWVDLRRGQVFKVDSNGRNLTEVTPGLRNWFKEHLQMKIIRSRIYNADTDAELSYYDIDNKFFGIGLSMGWDNRFKRVLITKKDYIPVGNPSEYQFRGGRFYRNGQAVELQDTSHFTDVSFTVGYNCLKGEWKSYLSYTPDYYIEHQHYFQSGKNYSSESQEIGLWSHGLTNQSYQVFYGKLYPFVIEVPVREQYVNKILTNYQYRMDARRYQDEVNYQILRTTGFNKAWFYNDTNNSGELRMVIADKNDMSQRLRYPVTNDDSREILVTEVDQKININDYFNEVKDDTNNLPIWVKDVNDIDRKIDPRAVDYHRRWRDRLRGDWFLARFVNDIESRFKMIVRWFSNDEKVY